VFRTCARDRFEDFEPDNNVTVAIEAFSLRLPFTISSAVGRAPSRKQEATGRSAGTAILQFKIYRPWTERDGRRVLPGCWAALSCILGFCLRAIRDSLTMEPKRDDMTGASAKREVTRAMMIATG
jgi:hypothetical protein